MEGSSPQGLRDSGNVGLVPDSWRVSPGTVSQDLCPESNLSGCLVETLDISCPRAGSGS